MLESYRIKWLVLVTTTSKKLFEKTIAQLSSHRSWHQECWGDLWKSLQCLKGKSTRKSSIHAREILIKVPYNILASYGNVTLTADVMSVNGLNFFITHSRHLRFTTTELVQTTHNPVILKGILNARNIYKKRGFMVRMMMMDVAFESLRHALAEKKIEPNICSENEHVG